MLAATAPAADRDLEVEDTTKFVKCRRHPADEGFKPHLDCPRGASLELTETPVGNLLIDKFEFSIAAAHLKANPGGLVIGDPHFQTWYVPS